MIIYILCIKRDKCAIFGLFLKINFCNKAYLIVLISDRLFTQISPLLTRLQNIKYSTLTWCWERSSVDGLFLFKKIQKQQLLQLLQTDIIASFKYKVSKRYGQQIRKRRLKFQPRCAIWTIWLNCAVIIICVIKKVKLLVFLPLVFILGGNCREFYVGLFFFVAKIYREACFSHEPFVVAPVDIIGHLYNKLLVFPNFCMLPWINVNVF